MVNLLENRSTINSEERNQIKRLIEAFDKSVEMVESKMPDQAFGALRRVNHLGITHVCALGALALENGEMSAAENSVNAIGLFNGLRFKYPALDYDVRIIAKSYKGADLKADMSLMDFIIALNDGRKERDFLIALPTHSFAEISAIMHPFARARKFPLIYNVGQMKRPYWAILD